METTGSRLDPILDGDQIEMKVGAVQLTELVRGQLKCNYVVTDGKTKYQLFAVGGRFAATFGDALKNAVGALFGGDVKVELIQELDSWYVEVPRAMADGGGSGAEKLLESLRAG